MAVFKCKMCGGDLTVNNGETVATCEYCGTKQTLPKLDDDKKANLFDRANHFRRNNEFDKAIGIYEQILNEDSTDSECYWSLVLCRYGIEYVEDPSTHKRLPTVNRAQYTSIFDDEDYKSAIQYADQYQKELYEQEANTINEIQKGILAISQREEPFDVFICYKETDEKGRRTRDSVLANELYHQLSQEGYKVFFAKITLEDKLGEAYEPYIFAALNSAKVMVVIGTNPKYFNSVWVKNEWSRFLALIKGGANKILIPAYRDMDPYDLPEEFSHLQAQDMSKLGFMQDLIRGIRKITDAGEPKTYAQEIVHTEAPALNIAPLLERAYLFLEDGDWERADEFCEQVLNQDPRCARAYLGKLMAELNVNTFENLSECAQPFDTMDNYQKTVRFADDELKNTLSGYINHIKERNEQNRLQSLYDSAVNAMNTAQSENDYISAARRFGEISEYKNSAFLNEVCLQKADEIKKDLIYNRGINYINRLTPSITEYEDAIKEFTKILTWKDSQEKIEECKIRIAEIKAEQLKRIQYNEKIRKRNKKAALISIAVVVAAVAMYFPISHYSSIYMQKQNYTQAVKLFNNGEYFDAYGHFIKTNGYKDTSDYLRNIIENSIKNYRNMHTIAASNTTFAVKNDGTVFATGITKYGQQYVDGWSDITAIASGYFHTAGLKSAGSVVAVGDNEYGQCNVENWTNITSIDLGRNHTAGLKSDGTVVAVGNNASNQCDVNNWFDIVAIACGENHTVGLKNDGTVVAVGDNLYGQCDVENWKDIIAIAAGDYYTIGLKSDGTLVAAGDNKYGQCDIENWSGIIAVSAGYYHTVGLKIDGTVVAVGSNAYGECDVTEWKDIYGVRDVTGWKDIAAVAAGKNYTVGLKKDGTLVTAGDNQYGQCDVENWSDIKLPYTKK